MGHGVLDHPLLVIVLVFTTLTVLLGVILQNRVRVLTLRNVLATDRTLLIALVVSDLGLLISWLLFSAGQPQFGAALSALAFIVSLVETLTLGALHVPRSGRGRTGERTRHC